MKLSRKPVLAVALAAMLSTVGCSTFPTAPVLSNDPAPAAAGGGSLATTDAGIVSPPGLMPPPQVTADLTVTKMVNGTLGGTIQAGPVEIEIPNGAYVGPAEITITVPDSTQLHCKLDITAGKNGFDQPVLLRFDAAGHGDVRTLGIWWLNETSGEWELVESTGDPATGKVEALLPHFSEYKVDTQFRTKAGW